MRDAAHHGGGCEMPGKGITRRGIRNGLQKVREYFGPSFRSKDLIFVSVLAKVTMHNTLAEWPEFFILLPHQSATLTT
jgi:hypothetical protein